MRYGLGGHPLTPTLEERLERKTHAKQTEIESSSIPYTPLTVLYVLAPVLLIPIRPLYIVMDYGLHKAKSKSSARVIRASRTTSVSTAS